MTDFSWLNDLISNLPEVEEERQNIFEIAGFPNREQVVSNMLAFYFDETQQHGFGALFFNSLLKCAKTKLKERISVDIFSGPFEVAREADYIDLLISSKETDETGKIPQWVIIIENKVYADLYNKLESYWKRTAGINKLGIVLSLKEESLKQIKSESVVFVSITHKELLDEVQKQLFTVYQDADDRHLLLLKDYMHNIYRHYKKPEDNRPMEDTLLQFQHYRGPIRELIDTEVEVKKYLMETFIKVFGKYGFEPSTSSPNTYTKHFYASKDSDLYNRYDTCRGFRFWTNTNTFIREGRVLLYFELHGEGVKYGEELKQYLSDNQLLSQNGLKKGTNGGPNYTYFHMAVLYQEIELTEELTFEQALERLLANTFFKGGKKSMIEESFKWYHPAP